MTTKDLKSEIKALAAKKKATKEQRKTVKFTGTRSLTPWEAQILALRQKEELKHMYIAYALLRGKSIETAIGPKTEYLEPNTEYHYRIRAANEMGESFGEDMTFTTPFYGGAPVAVTLPATNIG